MTCVVGIVPGITDDIRLLAESRRIRVTEFFQDYDKLRSGFLTSAQFLRCLWQTLHLKLSSENEQELIKHYDTQNDGSINYVKFCNDISINFDPNNTKIDPSQQISVVPKYLGCARVNGCIPQLAKETLSKLLKRLQTSYLAHGINLRTMYHDFDKHHLGIVTESQFYRNFPGQSGVSDEEMKLLMEAYYDPKRPGLVNYLNFHNDLLAATDSVYVNGDDKSAYHSNVDWSPLQKQVFSDTPLNEIFEKLCVVVFKNGIRSFEYFRDYDKLRCGAITENQFTNALRMAVGKYVQLSCPEIKKIVEFYRRCDGHVRYKEFCDMLENTFNFPYLEKNPTVEVVRPVRGSLFKSLECLNSVPADNRLHHILNELRDKCRKQRLLVYPYFKDYDRSKAHTGLVTSLQFGRILHFLGMTVSVEDLKLIVDKFKDRMSGDINYPAFVQAVDYEHVAHIVEETLVGEDGKCKSEKAALPEVDVSLEDIVTRIRHIVLTLRLRVQDYFQDFDPLRTGSITKARFRRCLATMHLSKLGQHDLSEKQFTLLCQNYLNPKDNDHVLYTKFVDHIDCVFTEKDLELDPLYKVPPHEAFLASHPGTVDFAAASGSHKALYEESMARICARVKQYRILLKPVFQDFDRHNNGLMTRGQFHQALSMLGIHLSSAHISAIEARFCNDKGFNYMGFLNAVQPFVPQELMYVKRQEEIRGINAKGGLPELNPESDLENILLKIKTKVYKERIRVGDFMGDYDKLHSGRMLKTSFRRAINLARLALCESELAVVEDKYQSVDALEYIDYRAFCDEVESIFTMKNLEKMPLEEVQAFQPSLEWEMNCLSEEEIVKFTHCLEKIKEKVRQHRMQLFPLFEDYDQVHNGAVSASQFHRVLSELGLESMLDRQEIELLSKRFAVRVGGRQDVNYVAFCELVYHLCGFEWRKP